MSEFSFGLNASTRTASNRWEDLPGFIARRVIDRDHEQVN